MSPRRWRLAALLALSAAAWTAIIFAVTTLVAVFAFPRTAVPGDVTRADVARRLLLAAVLALPAAAVAGWWLGLALARPLQRLRRAVLTRPDRLAGEPLVSTRLREAHELGAATEVALLDAASALARVEAQRGALSTLVESASEGLLRVAADGRIVFANPACRQLLDLPQGAVGAVFPSLIRNADLRRMVARAIGGEQVTGTEVSFGHRQLLVSAQPLRRPGDSPGGAVIAFADLTVLRQLEGVRRDFVANVSHELKTPLTSIRGYVETLLHEEPGPGTRRDFLEVVHKNATRLQNIVDDLLDLSRIESGGWRPKLEAVDPAEVAHDAWGSCREPAQQRHVTFTDPAGGLLVSADPDALRQVFANLFDNALRHTPDGGTIAVRVSASPTPPSAPAPARLQGTWIHIEVSDTGTGIPRAALPRIFERFYRVEPSRSRAAGGTGLGLAIVKHLVESMGGALHADSVLGQGTTIHLFLPAAPVT